MFPSDSTDLRKRISLYTLRDRSPTPSSLTPSFLLSSSKLFRTVKKSPHCVRATRDCNCLHNMNT